MNKLLKDAIADAKAVRETALANAKLALEEAFAPQMNKIFSEKIKMEMANDPEETEEGTYMEDEMAPENEMMNATGRMKELAGLEEYDEFEDDTSFSDDDDDDEDEFGLPDDVEDLDLDPDEEGFDTGDSDDEDAGYDDKEPIDEDLEEIIRQLEEDEMASDLEEGDDEEELPGSPTGGEYGGEFGNLEEDLDEEINLDEVIAALREGEDFEDDDRTSINEADDMMSMLMQGLSDPGALKDKLQYLANNAQTLWDAANSIATVGDDPDSKVNLLKVLGIASGITGGIAGLKKLGSKIDQSAGKTMLGKGLKAVNNAFKKVAAASHLGESNSMEDESKMEELNEAYSVIEHLREKINEVNLLNAKLLYVNKLFKKHNLSESEKVRVVETFDRAVTVRETKIIYTTLSESLSTRVTKKTKVMTEGFASSPVKKTEILTESNSIVSRFQKLAGLTNEE